MIKTIFQLLMLVLPFGLYAQDCSDMFSYLREGVTFEYTNYDKKGKVESVGTQKVAGVEERNDTLIANINFSMVDKKGKEAYTNSFPLKCYDKVFYVDMRSVIPQQSNQNQSPDMQIEVNGDDLTFPPDMKPGQTLPDGEMEMKMSMGAIRLMSVKYATKNRKVEARETITTPAGTFDCVRISYDFEYQLMGTRTEHIEYWYDGSVGMVKSVTYDKRGEEKSRTELTRLEK